VLSPGLASFFLLSPKNTFSIVTKEPAQIGIIAPYRAQCMKLRKTLEQIAPEIKIGSVEEFQGDVSGLTERYPSLTKYGYAGTSRDHYHDCPK
jgi:hypothetical protein